MSTPESQPAVPRPKLRWFQYSLRTLLLLTLLCAVGLKIGQEWQRRRRHRDCPEVGEACLDQDYPNCGRMEWDKPWPPLPACPVPLDDAERPIVVKMAATRLESSRERIAGLRLLLESDPEGGLNVLRGALGSERDPALRALLLHLIGLYRDATTADVVRHYLDDPDAGVRAAAADAIGLIHCPAYAAPLRSQRTGEAALASDPPINVDPLIKRVLRGPNMPAQWPTHDEKSLPMNVIELPDSMRQALETMMLQGASSEERTAAARALLRWPPAKYRFRMAEWGVWINDGGELKLLQSVIEEIPPFVHRTGNTTSLAARPR